MSKLRHVDLCSGIGGFSLGFSWAELSKTIMFCDTEKWCRQILAKNFPNTPIATDVKELANDPERLVPNHDILTAGYPCQPFSVAGLRKGEEDDRHIWPYIFRIVTFKRPSWCVFENVYGHVALGLDKVLSDMENQGYATRTFIVPACAKNAPHRRDRLWIVCKNVGDSSSGGRGEFRVSEEKVGGTESEEAQSIRTSSTRTTMGDTQYNGSSTTQIRGSNEEDARGSQKGEIQAKQSEGASGRGDHETMAHTTSDRWNKNQSSEEQRSTFGQSEEGGMLELERGSSQSREQTMAYTKCLGWEQRTEIQGEFDREEPSDQLDFSSEGRRRSRASSHVANTNGEGLQGIEETRDTKEIWKDSNELFTGYGGKSNVANTNSQRTSRRISRNENAKDVGQPPRIREDEGIWFSEPNVGRVAHGIPKRVDRLKGLGNAIVPQIAMQIGLAIKKELENE